MDKKEMYKLAIDARDRLNENYHKWMTFYYLAMGSILVAVTNKLDDSVYLLVFSVIGIVISILWNLSCKGYYYWSKSWIELIIKHEKELMSESRITVGVYSTFSHSVHNNIKPILYPNSYANISTPKLTLIFSYFSILSWLVYFVYLWINISSEFHICSRCLIPFFFLAFILLTYTYLFPKYAKSRNNDLLHDYFH